jgi:hypothetical protein
MHKEGFIINRNTLLLHNKPKAEVHPGHKLTGLKEEEHTPTCFDPAGSSSGRTFCYHYTRVALYS